MAFLPCSPLPRDRVPPRVRHPCMQPCPAPQSCVYPVPQGHPCMAPMWGPLGGVLTPTSAPHGHPHFSVHTVLGAYEHPVTVRIPTLHPWVSLMPTLPMSTPSPHTAHPAVPPPPPPGGAGTCMGWGWAMARVMGSEGQEVPGPACTLTPPFASTTLGCRYDRAEDAEQQVPERSQSRQREGNTPAAGAGPGHAGGRGKTHLEPPHPEPMDAHSVTGVGMSIPMPQVNPALHLHWVHCWEPTCAAPLGTALWECGGVPGPCLHPLAPTHWASCPQPTPFEEEAASRVDDLLESYMGIRDSELGEWAGWAGGAHPGPSPTADPASPPP